MDPIQQSSSSQNQTNTSGGIFGTPLVSESDVSQEHVTPSTVPTSTPTVSPQSGAPLNDDQDDWVPASPLLPHDQEDLNDTPPPSAPLENKTAQASTPEQATNPQTSTQNTSQKELEALGLSVVDDTSQEKVASQESNIFSKTSAFVPSDTRHKAEPKKDTTPVPKTDPASNPAHSPSLDTYELEQDFSQTFNSLTSAVSPEGGEDHLRVEEDRLKALHSELKSRANIKKQEVKQKLEQLKKEKEVLGTAIAEIKEIEDIAKKIEEKLGALQSIDTELDSLEAKARQELT